MIHSIKVGGNAFLKHGIASSLRLLKMLILIKDRAVSSLLTYNEKFERDIPRIFPEAKSRSYIIFDYCDAVLLL